jgi:mannose/cellobiose epimerase-like protein (N-acyl-D-glucosamine 2-epimerase family)
MTDSTGRRLAPHDGLIGAIDAYLRDGMLPLWASRGWDDARGGWHERLRADHTPVGLDYRRLTVCARQLFVYGKAAQLDLMAAARPIADRTFRYLVDHFYDRDFGGWFCKVDTAGGPLDRTKDLYGHAFVLLGLAQYCSIAPESRALDLVRHTDGVIAEKFLLAEGWYAATAEADWGAPGKALLQNPHMHLLEAYLAAYAMIGDEAYRKRAEHLIALFRTRLLDPATRTIREFRDEQGRPDALRGHIVEPGHHFEWSWLLQQAADVLGSAEYRSHAVPVFAWAATHGIDFGFGGVFDQVGTDGAVIADTKRLWPLTEYIKTRAVRFRQRGEESERAEVIPALDLLFSAYLLPDGGWRERLRQNLTCYDDELPATSCYHILVALLEARAALGLQVPAAPKS